MDSSPFIGLLQLVTCLTVQYISTSYQSGVKDYCFDQAFQAECDANEVIVMQSAEYGRMDLGQCITRQVDGCKTKNVMPVLDNHCSGKRLCEMEVADKELLKSKPCPMDFTAYLKAEYHCQPVQQKSDQACSPYRHDSIPLAPRSGYISSIYSSPNCLYKVEVTKGQKITITLKDFQPYRNVSEKEGSPTICQQLVTIREPLLDTAETICRNQERERTKYTSQTNSVEMLLKNIDTSYLIGYKIIGCPSLQPPKGAHIVRETHHEAVIKCNHTTEHVTIKCNNGVWAIRRDLRCSVSGLNNKNNGNHEKHEDSIGLPSLGVSMLIIFGVALVIVIYVAGMIVCVMYLKRKRRGKQRPPKTIHGEGQDDLMLPYDKIFTNPHEEHLPMLLKSGTLRHSQQPVPQSQCECNEAHCQIHGPFSSCESPYIVAGPNYKLYPCEGHSTMTSSVKGQTTGTFPSCCIPANSMPANIDRDDQHNNINNSTYQSSRSLKGVRFATLNGRERKPFYLELNSRGLNNSNRDSCPDVLPTESSDKIEETQLSTFR